MRSPEIKRLAEGWELLAAPIPEPDQKGLDPADLQALTVTQRELTDNLKGVSARLREVAEHLERSGRV